MTIAEHSDLSGTVSDASMSDLRARASAVTAGMDTVQKIHPGYNWVWTDEIRCRGKECSASLDIPLLTSNNAVADRVFADHQQQQLQILLGTSPADGD